MYFVGKITKFGPPCPPNQVDGDALLTRPGPWQPPDPRSKGKIPCFKILAKPLGSRSNLTTFTNGFLKYCYPCIYVQYISKVFVWTIIWQFKKNALKAI